MLQLRTLTLQVAEIYSHVGSAKPAADWATFLADPGFHDNVYAISCFQKKREAAQILVLEC